MKKINLSLLILTLFLPFVGCSRDPDVVVDTNRSNHNQQFYNDLQNNRELRAHQRSEPMIRAFRPLNISREDFYSMAYVLNGSAEHLNDVSSLTHLAYNYLHNQSMEKYIVVTNEDMVYWTVLQKISSGTLIQINNNNLTTVFFIEGNIEERVNQHLRRNYLFITSGTFTYRTTLGDREVTRLKVLSDLTGY